MEKRLSMSQIKEAAAYIQSQTKHTPKIALILGSGLGSLAEMVKNPDVIPYGDIPHFPQSTVQGHSGQFVIGTLEAKTVMIMQGRVHFYEGYSPNQITFPVRVMKLLGIETLVVTNAAGGINRSFNAGELMLIDDHINFLGMGGNHPLCGPNYDQFGPRFLDMSQAYDRKLKQKTREKAKELGIPLHEGVYCCLSGPTFETPAELRMLQVLGADAVGMSTAPEVIVARHMDMRVLGISSITNIASLDGEHQASHEEVMDYGKQVAIHLKQLLLELLPDF
ncbi:MAG: purine-nucleoside phosphorylase [Anaerolineaceae bacterium]|nr:purine-nucleoside phosphorylase [Anaerolineaceae bacterium]